MCSHKVSVTTIRLWHSAKACRDSTQTSEHGNVTQTGGRFTGHGLPTLDLQSSKARFKLKSMPLIIKLLYNRRNTTNVVLLT